jgi:hypothetical protein
MRTYKSFIGVSLLLAGSIVFTQCKKETETVTEYKYIHDTAYVHDTAYGHSITGTATYMDYAGTVQPAKGAVVNLYVGSSASGSVVATSFADASGNYSLPYLLPGSYFIYAKYNTANVNARVINGINFETSPGYPVTMGTADMTKNLSLVNIAASGTNKVAMDTAPASLNSYRKVTFNTHSKITWESLYNQGNSQTIAGGFNVLAMNTFIFDEANPANISFDGYVLMSSLTTYEPARDALGTGCVSKTMRVDTIDATTPLPVTDTARLYTVSVEKYGDGYLAHCRMEAFYYHGPATPQVYPADTAGVPSQYWNTKMNKPVDVFFNFEKKKVFNAAGTTFNWEFIFEGMFTFKAKTDYYVSSSNIGDNVTVKPHILMRGSNNIEY